jgi:hypothetical protein
MRNAGAQPRLTSLTSPHAQFQKQQQPVLCFTPPAPAPITTAGTGTWLARRYLQMRPCLQYISTVAAEALPTTAGTRSILHHDYLQVRILAVLSEHG